ncbi:folate/biopterin family MFS transporter [Sphaerospermopsis kisseleviana CS-549]|uniref:Folate/biopterin family MFS transporter n=1 Tax=Sphaerospermopsis kisseleviana CS-549 TaxID=3021783 RepID=A0ABT4ZRT3_9CYAN|nr:folate/biopterin family MFS transporter [Sphaerospermopsis kisseleviana]MDB9442111.1 folate/biopterin family MFS transporter [Sphaerospermopsis kisseleviana CS-549]BAZ83413.1 folate/biopterin transporter [Sphaerospermopsis kisseleviana NIES-73]
MLIHSSDLPKVKDSVGKKILLGNEPKPELIAILAVYFVQGILGLSRLAVSFFLKDELQLSPVEVSALLGIVALPWMIKPLFGFISDGLPIFGYRRRPYLVLSGILGAGAWVSLGTIVNSSWAATIAIALSSLSVAFSDVIVDSLVVERARVETQAKAGSLQSLCWGATAMGGLMTAYFSGLLLEYFSTRTVFLVTAFFPLIISVVAWLIAETPINKDTTQPQVNNLLSTSNQIKQLGKAITQKVIWIPTAFIFLWQSTPSGEAAFFYFFTNELHFQPEFLGRVHLVTSLASLIGIWIFQRFLKSVPFRVICGWSIIISAALRMTMLILVTHTNRALGIDDQWFSLGDSLILAVMGQIAFMPVMVLAARICPLGIEATLFALLMSIFNLGGAISREFGALIMHWLGITENNFDTLWLLVIITNVIALVPLLFIKFLPGEETETITSTQNAVIQ